ILGSTSRYHKETISKAKEIIDEALKLFPLMGSTFALRGLTYLIYEYDWAKAEADLNEALRLSPRNELAHCFLAHLQVAQRRFEEGLAHAHIAAEVDYDSPMTVATEPWFMLFAGQVDEAVRKGEEVAEKFTAFAPAHDLLGHIYCANGAVNRAIERYERALDLDFLPDAVASLGFIYARMGDRKKALGQLALLNRAKTDKKIAYVSSYFEALVRVGLGERKRSLDALERAFEERCDWLIYLAVEPRWEKLRSEKRFLKLLHRVGIRKPNWE
ncbi:MAG: hypothetical protein M1423_02110, partial [Acidobacteria bacterium]|nr:hypothetical protein [Acidobacteriota bacterium]